MKNEPIKIKLHNRLSKLNLNNTQMNFDATKLCPSAMYDENSVYPKMESGYAFKPHMNDITVNEFSNKTFNQDGNEFVFLKIKYYNPPHLIFQHLAVREKVRSIEVNRMRNGYIINVLTSVGICEIVRKSGKVFEIYVGVFYRENLKIHLLEKLLINYLVYDKNTKRKRMIWCRV